MATALRCAIAEYDLDARDYLGSLLARLGRDVVAAMEDGPRLVAVCRDCRPDLVVTDYQIPCFDGLAAAAEVNRERPVPVVLVTRKELTDVIHAEPPACS